MSEEKKDKKLKEIVASLNSKDTKIVKKAIKDLRKHGQASSIAPLIDLLSKTENEEIKEEITKFLFDLKDASAIDPIITIIENNQYPELNSLLISIFWQSSLDANEYFEFFVLQAIKGDFMTCLETLTVIENFETTFSEAIITDMTYDLEDAIETCDSDKRELLISLLNVVKALPSEF